jgi:hypothetical protein
MEKDFYIMRLIKEQNAAKTQLIQSGLDNLEIELDENFQIVRTEASR